jgi:hypothetical protein
MRSFWLDMIRTFPNPVGAVVVWRSSHDPSRCGVGTVPFEKKKSGLERARTRECMDNSD